jgi:hypothetical protein
MVFRVLDWSLNPKSGLGSIPDHKTFYVKVLSRSEANQPFRARVFFVSEELIGPVVLSDLFRGVLRLQFPLSLTGGDALLCPVLFTSSYRNFSLSSYRSDAWAVSVTRRLYSDATSFLL